MSLLNGDLIMTKNFIISLLFIFFILSCEANKDIDLDIREGILKIIPYLTGEAYTAMNRDPAKILYRALMIDDVKAVEKALKKGADPNYCHGENGWFDSNPLSVMAVDFYDTYQRRKHERIPNPVPDVAIVNALLEAGADINRRPYIWYRVFAYDNSDIKSIKKHYESTEPEAMQEEIDMFISDANRLLEAFLKAGADPDKLGHPYPFSYEALKARITDEQANEYFSQGTRAINIAIEKGILWESQVDLLLQYTKLDEESLKAAERSNDPAMIEKINKLWNTR